VVPLLVEVESTLLVTDARRQRLASSSSEELEDETSLSSHAI